MTARTKIIHDMRILVQLRDLRDAYNDWDLERFKRCMTAAGDDLPSILLCRDSVSATPLYNAVYDEREEFVRTLLEAGAPVEEGTTHAPPLIIAAERGYMGIARLLLDHGANVDGFDQQTKNRPLLEALLWNRTEMALFLIDRGADCGDHFMEEGGSAAIDSAIAMANVPVFLKLLEKGALATRTATPLALAAEYGAEKIVDVCLADRSLRAPLLDDGDPHRAVLDACKTEDMRQRLLSWRTQMKIEGSIAIPGREPADEVHAVRKRIGMAL